MQRLSMRESVYPCVAVSRGTSSVPASIYRFIPDSKLAFLLGALSFAALVGCGGSSEPRFTLAVVPSTISVVPGGATQSLTVGVSPVNGFKGSVSVVSSSLPKGVTASPSTLSLAAGSLGQISISASSSAVPGSSTITLTGTSGPSSQTVTSALTVGAPAPPMTSATLSTNSFTFGNNLVHNTVTQTVAVVTNTGADVLTMAPALSGDGSYSIVTGQSCGASLAPSATCNMVVSYNPAVASAPKTQDAVLTMGFGDVSAATSQTVAITGTSGVLSTGQVTATDNPQVALYTMTLPFPGSITVNFGATTDYGLKTWAQSTDTAGGQVSIFVAGMKASTAYHMAASVEFSNGITATDSDHTFTTGAVPVTSANIPALKITATTSPGMTPQSGSRNAEPLKLTGCDRLVRKHFVDVYGAGEPVFECSPRSQTAPQWRYSHGDWPYLVNPTPGTCTRRHIYRNSRSQSGGRHGTRDLGRRPECRTIHSDLSRNAM